MRRVGRLISIASPGHDHANRRLPTLQIANLHRRGMRPQQLPRPAAAVVRDPDRVPHIPSRMPRRNPQPVEVVLLQLDIRPLHDIESHIAEGPLHHPPSQRDRMQRPQRRPPTGQRHIQRRPIGGGGKQFRPPRRDRIFQRPLEPIRPRADDRSLFRRKLPHAPQHSRQPTPPSQPLHAPRLQPGLIARLRERRARFRL